jgi:hypothetical protein
MTDLLKGLKDSRTDNDNEWNETVATNPASLGKKLRELENSLSAVGITVDFLQRNGSERLIRILSTSTLKSATDADSETF